jgi:hypothetical protein
MRSTSAVANTTETRVPRNSAGLEILGG